MWGGGDLDGRHRPEHPGGVEVQAAQVGVDVARLATVRRVLVGAPERLVLIAADARPQRADAAAEVRDDEHEPWVAVEDPAEHEAEDRELELVLAADGPEEVVAVEGADAERRARDRGVDEQERAERLDGGEEGLERRVVERPPAVD